jgi:hypothetical protein
MVLTSSIESCSLADYDRFSGIEVGVNFSFDLSFPTLYFGSGSYSYEFPSRRVSEESGVAVEVHSIIVILYYPLIYTHD